MSRCVFYCRQLLVILTVLSLLWTILFAQAHASTLSIMNYDFEVGKINKMEYMPTGSFLVTTDDAEFIIFHSHIAPMRLKECFGYMPEINLMKAWVLGDPSLTVVSQQVDQEERCLKLKQLKGRLPYESLTILRDASNEFAYLVESEDFGYPPVLKVCHDYECVDMTVMSSNPMVLKNLIQQIRIHSE